MNQNSQFVLEDLKDLNQNSVRIMSVIGADILHKIKSKNVFRNGLVVVDREVHLEISKELSSHLLIWAFKTQFSYEFSEFSGNLLWNFFQN